MFSPGTLVDAPISYSIHSQLFCSMRVRYSTSGTSPPAEMSWYVRAIDQPPLLKGLGLIVATRTRSENDDRVVYHFVVTPDQMGWIAALGQPMLKELEVAGDI